MKRWLPFPLLWALLVAMWLMLYQTLALAHIVLAALIALVAVQGLYVLQDPAVRLRRPLAAIELSWLVLIDVVRSNVAVARLVLNRATHGQTAGFLEIPLALRNPVGLAALACIVTSTPGTAWAGYDPRSGVFTMHVLDLVDEQYWRRTIKERYEARLMEIFE